VLTFYDDDASGAASNVYNISFDLTNFLNGSVTPGTTSVAPFVITYDAFSNIINGLLSVYLEDDKNGNHDFYFAMSELTATGTRLVADDDPLPGPEALAEAPEPASILLLGTGLVGLAVHRLRRSRRA
jgi:hypothetical protein